MGHPLLEGRILRLAAIAVSLLAVSGVLTSIPGHLGPLSAAWLGAYAVYVGALWLSFSSARAWQTPKARVSLLAIQGVAPFVMASLVPCHFGGLLHVIVAWQAALLLRPVLAIAWVAGQIGVMTALICQTCSPDMVPILVFIGLQFFALITASATRREVNYRAELSQANAELKATRAILAESSRIGERMRIARDLHDTVGHHLTALSLNLEVATHADGQKREHHVAKSKEIASRLLGDVRDVVSALRSDEGVDVACVLAPLVEDAGDLKVELDVPTDLRIECPERADALVRCVQEIVTNARKHACCATRVAIRIHKDGSALAVHAEDDGRPSGEIREGFGLRGMKERFEKIGGWIRASARPGGGFAIDASLPLGTEAR